MDLSLKTLLCLGDSDCDCGTYIDCFVSPGQSVQGACYVCETLTVTVEPILIVLCPLGILCKELVMSVRL